MVLASSALFALSASLDALIAGISFGLRRIRISCFQNLLVSLITLAGTTLSIALGQALLPIFPQALAKRAGSAVLLLMGAFSLLKFMWRTLKKYLLPSKGIPDDVPKGPAEPTDILGLLLLGLALSLNNMGIGISASIRGLPLLTSSILTFLLSAAFLEIGNRLGTARFLRHAQRFAEPLSGLLLLGLGLL